MEPEACTQMKLQKHVYNNRHFVGQFRQYIIEQKKNKKKFGVISTLYKPNKIAFIFFFVCISL